MVTRTDVRTLEIIVSDVGIHVHVGIHVGNRQVHLFSRGGKKKDLIKLVCSFLVSH